MDKVGIYLTNYISSVDFINSIISESLLNKSYLIGFGILYIIFLYIFYLFLERKGILGRYYCMHFISNMLIIFFTIPDLIHTYFDFANFLSYNLNYLAVIITFSIHIFHVIWYFKKLRFDDWLHHILMVLVALPIGLIGKSGSLMGHSLFYLTGLPGGIDYLLLFLVRNNCLSSIKEKRINTFLNLWIRCPGCIAHSILTVVGFLMNMHNSGIIDYISTIFTSLLVYWNGIYFMNQIVVNYNIIIYDNKKN